MNRTLAGAPEMSEVLRQSFSGLQSSLEGLFHDEAGFHSVSSDLLGRHLQLFASCLEGSARHPRSHHPLRALASRQLINENRVRVALQLRMLAFEADGLAGPLHRVDYTARVTDLIGKIGRAELGGGCYFLGLAPTA